MAIRMPRFRLRTLLLALTAICLWLGWHAQRARKERLVVSRIQQLGGTVAYDIDIDPQTYQPYAAQATGDRASFARRLAQVRRSIPGNLFVSVFKVDLHDSSLSETDLKQLDHLRGLRILDLYGSDAPDDAIEDFRRRNPKVAVFYAGRPVLGLVMSFNCTVSDTARGGPAEKHGLRKGDTVVRLDGQGVRNAPHFQYLVALHHPGDELTLEVRRGPTDLRFAVNVESEKRSR